MQMFGTFPQCISSRLIALPTEFLDAFPAEVPAGYIAACSAHPSTGNASSGNVLYAKHSIAAVEPLPTTTVGFSAETHHDFTGIFVNQHYDPRGFRVNRRNRSNVHRAEAP